MYIKILNVDCERCYVDCTMFKEKYIILLLPIPIVLYRRINFTRVSIRKIFN